MVKKYFVYKSPMAGYGDKKIYFETLREAKNYVMNHPLFPTVVFHIYKMKKLEGVV